ncbi:MAG: FtsK/SpoIIIE domain-containing protein [Pseudomonadota bacterium]
MNSNELIGRVAATYLAQQLENSDRSSTARYLIDSLSAEQTAAVAKAILADVNLAELIDIKLPDAWLAGLGVPDSCLTSERATHHRSTECQKPARLLATPGDDERQSLAELTVIDTAVLRSQVDIWVSCASAEIPVTDQNRRIWSIALNGLTDVAQVTLDAFARYNLRVRAEIDSGGVFPDVMGNALPVMQWPRNPGLFRSLNAKTVGHASKWKLLFATVQKKQACYLKKFTPNNQTLSADDLTTAFDKVKDVIPEGCHPTIDAFIAAPSKWNEQASALANIDWELIKPLFDGLRPERFNLGQATLDFFDEQEGDLLSAEDRAYLEGLIKRNSSQSTPDDEDFYHRNRLPLKDQTKLKSKWDRFIFGSPVESTDFFSGLALCLQSLFDSNLPPGSKRELLIRSDKRSRSDLRKINVDAGRFFAFRYRGLRTLLRSGTFEVGELFDFDKFHEDNLRESRGGKKKYKQNDSAARSALEIKFFVHLNINDGEIENHRQLIWRYDPNSIGSELVEDWGRLSEHALIYSEVARDPIGPKGQAQPLDLRQVRSLTAGYRQNRGSLVPAYTSNCNLAVDWRKNLTVAGQQERITGDVQQELLQLFDEFENAYVEAIKKFQTFSSAALEIEPQYRAFGRLVEALLSKARGDRLRDLLLKPVMAIGVVPVRGAAPAAIIAPWNPIRMQAMASKARSLSDLIRQLLTQETVSFGDPALYFKELRDELEHPYYPELALGWRDRKPELLSLTDSFMDYSLHELPLRGSSEESETNENPTQSATQIVDMVQRYLDLYPHERSNLSAVLYNCDSSSLPQAVVDRINEMHEDEDDMRCEVVLRHRDRDKLHRLYEQILESSDADGDGFVASEASRDFMARLRIGIMADEAAVPDQRDGPMRDIVFLHDVISRHAVLEWYREDATPMALEDLVPSRWSRRRPSPWDEEKSIVYLCCPVQTKEGWDYITAITSFFKPDWADDLRRRYLPARQLDFHDPTTNAIFAETHNLGNWVVNFDELLDRRQLLTQNVRVIRYKQSATQGRNLLVSSNAPLGLLQTLLVGRVRDLTPDIDDTRVRTLVQRLIDDANRISGDIVLRAAKHGRNASELLGLVLSHYLVRQELGSERRVGAFFLDDYAEWLGEDGEQIADLLFVSPEELPDGRVRLSVVVTEAKYIAESALADKRKESQRQLRDSVNRIEEALFSDPERLDRSLWLSRFSDLLVTGIPYTVADPIDPIALRRKIREGKCEVFLRGYSHVFVSTPLMGAVDCSDFTQVANCDGGYQEIYSREKTRALLLAYERNVSPNPVRYSVVEKPVIEAQPFRKVGGIFSHSVTSTVVKIPAQAPVLAPAVHVSAAATAAVAIEEAASLATLPATDTAPILTASVEMAQASVATEKRTQVIDVDVSGWSSADVARIVSQRLVRSDVTEEEETWLRGAVTVLRTALQQFQLNSKIAGNPVLTPNAGIVRLQGASNLTVDLVMKRRAELLTTYRLNVISVRGEPGVVSVSIARPTRKILHTLDCWKQWNPLGGGNQKLPIAVVEDNGELLYMSPTDNAPHTLIAGSTGSGKSVLMQNIILSIACSNTPEQARIILIDPKMGVDYFAFDGLPHLGDGLIEEQFAAIAALKGLLEEMDRRYTVLRKNRCANIFELNRKQGATERLPCLWVIHDEFAEWMMTESYSDTVSEVVSRLGVKARAAGIFLIFAAQRPDNSVFPMQLRSNLGNRLILRVDSEGTSEIALGIDKGGAERLLGRGHMAAKLEGMLNIVYCQVPVLSSDEISLLVNALILTYPEAQ